MRLPAARERTSDLRRSSGSMQVIRVHSRAGWLLYAEALLTTLVTVVVSWVFRDALAATRLLLFWPTSVLVAWRCGLGPVAIASFVGAMFQVIS